MILYLIQCNMCGKTHNVSLDKSAEWQQLPPEWFTLSSSDDRSPWHFCTKGCLAQWVGANGAPAQQDITQSKIRRFMLVDGETADEYEAVKFSSGHVVVDFDANHFPQTYSSWDDLKQTQDGDGVTWIDQEVKADANSN